MLKSLHTESTAGGSLYIRVLGLTGSEAGKVLDFSDNTFKALASCTTPYQTATERTAFAGTGRSGYTTDLDLSEVNAEAVERAYLVKWYNNGSPADADTAIAETDVFIVANSREGVRGWTVQCELGVKSTAGSTAQLSVWLEHGGERVDLDGIDATPTMSTLVREHGAGSPLFTATGDAGDLTNDVFEVEQSSPGFTDDRLYEVTASITVNGTTYSTTRTIAVIG